MSQIIVFIIRRPLVIISAVVVLSAIFGFGLWRGVRLDVSPLGFVEQGSQERADFESARKNFGGDDYLLVAVVCDDVFAPAGLARLRKLHEQIAKTKGVAESLSLINAPCARSVGGMVSGERLIPNELIGGLEDGDEADGVKIEEIRRAATSDRLYLGNLVSADSRTAALNILLKSDLPTATRHVITEQIYESARNAGFDQVYFAGDPFSQWRSTEAVKSDLRVFLPLTLLLIAFLLWLCFRSFVAVILPLITIGVGLLWLMGLMAYFEAHFTILALMLPTLMLAIGCSYMVHVINQIGISRQRDREMERQRDGEAKRERAKENSNLSVSPSLRLSVSPSPIEEALKFISLPVIVSALTIIAGFMSLAFTAIPAIRTTAIYSAIGAAFTMILSLTFIPAVLALMGERAIEFRIGLTGGMVKLLEGVGRWPRRTRRCSTS